MDAATAEYVRKIAKILIDKGKDYVKASLEKDAANRYSLKQRWYLPLIEANGLPPGEYHGPIINVLCDGEWAQVWLNPYESTAGNNICDGASRFPDVVLGIDLRPGAAFHDPWYLEIEAIAKAFSCDGGIVRDFGDNAFTSINLAENAGKRFVKTVSTMVHWGVRIAGGIYHRRHMAAGALALVLLSGCAGCVSSSFDDPSGYQSPIYEKVAATNAAPSTLQPSAIP